MMCVDHEVNICLPGPPPPPPVFKPALGYLPYAARVAPHDPDNLKKAFRLCSAFLCDKGCMGPNSHVSGMLNVEFEEWWVLLRRVCP